MLRDHSYDFASYHNHMKYAKCVILRHDVDNSLEKALKLAELEHSMGVASTYFVLLSTDFYNIASEKSTGIIKEIKSLGHEIGLHFDEVKYQGGANKGSEIAEEIILSYITKETTILSDLLEMEIKAVSMHRPSKATLEKNYEIKGLVNSYSKTFFEEFKYVSDSRRHWRENIEELIISNRYDRLHILTHPIWYNEFELTLEASMQQYVNSANRERYHSMDYNIWDLKTIMKPQEVR